MAYYRRRRTTTRRPYRTFRKKSYRRKRKGLSNREKIYRFKRFTGALTGIIASNTVASFDTINFSLNDLPNYSEFTSMFQLYKITGVYVSILPPQNISNSLSTVANAQASARMFTCIDTVGGTYATIDDMRQNSTTKYTSCIKPHTRFIKRPQILDTSSYNVSPWISTTAPSTNYYGFEVGIEPIGSSTITSMTYSVEATYYLAFKCTK